MAGAEHSFDSAAQGKRTLPQQLVGATDACLVKATGRTVTLYPVLTESLAREPGLFDTAASAIDAKAAYAAAKKLRGELAAADCRQRVRDRGRTHHLGCDGLTAQLFGVK